MTTLSNVTSTINKFKRVSCLVLDNLGKERTTDAGVDYLHQIVDYRYRNELQTVVMTNSLNVECGRTKQLWKCELHYANGVKADGKADESADGKILSIYYP